MDKNYLEFLRFFHSKGDKRALGKFSVKEKKFPHQGFENEKFSSTISARKIPISYPIHCNFSVTMNILYARKRQQ